MNLNGRLALDVAPDAAVQGFHDPAVLGLFLPGTSEVTQTGPAAFDFVVVKDFGLLSLRLPGHLAIAPEGEGYGVAAQARHALGGSVTLHLHLAFAPDGAGCALRYSGTLRATGMAGRVLRDREEQVRAALVERLHTAREVLESRARPPV